MTFNGVEKRRKEERKSLPFSRECIALFFFFFSFVSSFVRFDGLGRVDRMTGHYYRPTGSLLPSVPVSKAARNNQRYFLAITGAPYPCVCVCVGSGFKSSSAQRSPLSDEIDDVTVSCGLDREFS